MKKENLQLLTAYNEVDIIDSQIQYLLEEDNNWRNDFIADKGREPTREDAYDYACEDCDLFSFARDDVNDTLTDWLATTDCNGLFKATVKGFGWRKLDGSKEIELKEITGSELLSEILPKTDCTFRIYKYRNGLKIRNSHHDAPTGETYYIFPFSKKDMKEWEKTPY